MSHKEHNQRVYDWVSRNREKWSLYRKNYYAAHPDFRLHLRNYKREYQRKIRAELIALLGGKCCRCGFSDERAFQIDHVNGGGGKERRRFGRSATLWYNILMKVKAGSKEYQLLCANCNQIKERED